MTLAVGGMLTGWEKEGAEDQAHFEQLKWQAERGHYDSHHGPYGLGKNFAPKHFSQSHASRERCLVAWGAARQRRARGSHAMEPPFCAAVGVRDAGRRDERVHDGARNALARGVVSTAAHHD